MLTGLSNKSTSTSIQVSDINLDSNYSDQQSNETVNDYCLNEDKRVLYCTAGLTRSCAIMIRKLI